MKPLERRLSALEQQQQDDDTEWQPGMLPLAGDNYPDFWIPGPDGQRVPVSIDNFV